MRGARSRSRSLTLWAAPAALAALVAVVQPRPAAPRAPGSGSRAASGPEAGPALVLVSLDGFRWDYGTRTPTPALDRLAAEGVRADWLTPVFPAKTFPNHYTLATGLYPAHHGIVSNDIYDPVFDARFSVAERAEANRQRWWGGEPIWVTARRQGLRTAAYFWPGSEAEGQHPDEWRPFDGSVPFAERVDQALVWLSEPEPRRFDFVAVYMQEPNESGHAWGPMTPETDAAVREVDAALGRLLDGLDRLGLRDRVDVVVVSDHGMASVDLSRVIPLRRYADLDGARILDQGPLLTLWPTAGTEAAVLAGLRRAPHLAVDRREELPERFHYAGNRRIAPIVGIPELGWSALARPLEETDLPLHSRGEHAFDNEAPEMRGIFFARGPSFRAGLRVRAFSSVHVYDLLCAALGIEPAPGDGDPAVTASFLRR